MANNNSNLGNAAFSGFPGGYNTGPGAGNVSPAATGSGNPGVITLGTNLPHVDPNNFQGTVHWGPEQAVTGAQIPFGNAGAGFGAGSN